MTRLSPDQQSSARKTETAILKGLASAGQVNVANALGVSESTVSRWKDKEISDTANLLAALGLKAVPVSMKCYEPKSIDALLTLAKERMAQIESHDQLVWED